MATWRSRRRWSPRCRDVDSVYLMWPAIPVEPRVVEAIAGHAQRVAYLSTDVADLAEGEQATAAALP